MQAQACENTPECVALIQCYQACAMGDQTCYDKCFWAHPGGHATYEAIFLCLDCQQCPSDCNAKAVGCPPGM
jgi:hypothetical protein